MTRRSFIQAFTAAVACLACHPHAIIPPPQTIGTKLEGMLSDEADMILKKLMRPSPWLALLEPGAFPEHAGITTTVLESEYGKD